MCEPVVWVYLANRTKTHTHTKHTSIHSYHGWETWNVAKFMPNVKKQHTHTYIPTATHNFDVQNEFILAQKGFAFP